MDDFICHPCFINRDSFTLFNGDTQMTEVMWILIFVIIFLITSIGYTLITLIGTKDDEDSFTAWFNKAAYVFLFSIAGSAIITSILIKLYYSI